MSVNVRRGAARQIFPFDFPVNNISIEILLERLCGWSDCEMIEGTRSNNKKEHAAAQSMEGCLPAKGCSGKAA